MSDKRITIVTAYFQPEISPITHLYADLAEDLTRYGAKVTVVTNVPTRGLDEQTRSAYRSRLDEQTPEGYRILRIGGGKESTSFLVRGFQLLKGALSLYQKAKQAPTDVYLLGSMPPFLGLVGAWLHRKAETVYILQDIFPDTMVLMGKFSNDHPVTRLCRAMERKIYRDNSRFVTISKDMANTLKQRGVDSDRIAVIPNWADTHAVTPVDKGDNPLFQEMGLPKDRFIALYAGTLGLLQCPDMLLDAAKALQGHPEILFVILGGGGGYATVERRIREEGLKNVQLFPLQPQERVSQVYSLGDVALVPLKAGVAAAAMPSKTWTAMAAARPVIATAEPGTAWAEAIEGADCGFIAAPENPAALAEAVLKAYKNRDTLPEKGQRARAYVKAHCNRENATRAYYQWLLNEK